MVRLAAAAMSAFILSIAPAADRVRWLLGQEPATIPPVSQPEFLTAEEASLMTHDRWAPGGVSRVPINFRTPDLV